MTAPDRLTEAQLRKALADFTTVLQQERDKGEATAKDGAWREGARVAGLSSALSLLWNLTRGEFGEDPEERTRTLLGELDRTVAAIRADRAAGGDGERSVQR
ncbi:hypothetical protein P3102_35435 [Amycolatopsis sp. QT-25]|uniref:hypothetical protein n=1 Tax=Amycolatopsis sp. QT-25 TaxID=3034022 RepID=UPI0023EDCD95|nr:hypothetical protein [Amycolatopsis sp. QT-25]WET79264.1 hypothetical protein P3102_35435 [Amycolatopsis sp. QT-25]